VKFFLPLLIALSPVHLAFSQQPQSAEAPAKTSREIETATARVEQVFKVEDDGYQSISYLVSYHGQHVIIEDTLCSTDYALGDKIYFLVLRHDMSQTHCDGKKLLHFMVR